MTLLRINQLCYGPEQIKQLHITYVTDISQSLNVLYLNISKCLHYLYVIFQKNVHNKFKHITNYRFNNISFKIEKKEVTTFKNKLSLHSYNPY
jgi:hypothetical protein